MTKVKRAGKPSRLKKQLYRIAVAAAILALGAGTCTAIVNATSCSSVSDCNAQISNLSNQNAAAQNSLAALEQQAGSYQAAIEQLQQQINGIQASINDNEAKQAALQTQINDYKAQIVVQKQLLGDDIRTMYVNGDMTSLEMLASSNNLSSYVDQQEYRNILSDKIQSAMATIKQLESQVLAKKAQVDSMLTMLGTQQAQLAAAQAQQNQLLSYNQQQQDAFNAQISSNNSQISQLEQERQQQIVANERFLQEGDGKIITSGACGGGYPASAVGPDGNWGCNYPQDNTVDNWGEYNRECVSYAAWKVYQTYGYMPWMPGNAYQWPALAAGLGVAEGSTPKVNSVAIIPPDFGGIAGSLGHAVWVEAVNPDGSILVSQYNFYGNGTYSTMEISASVVNDLTYLYFN